MSSSSSSDESSDGGGKRASYADFDAAKFKQHFAKMRETKARCCGGGQCLATLSKTQLNVHISLMEFIYSIKPPDLRNQVLRTQVMSCYMVQVNEKGNHCEYRVPAFKKALCQKAFLELFNISRPTFERWLKVTKPNRDVLPPKHGLTGQTSNAAKPEAREAVMSWLRGIADFHGHALPVRIRAADRKLMDKIEGSEQMVVLPPRFTKRSLYDEYIMFQQDEALQLAWPTFLDALNKDMPWIRVSLRERGLCDTCFGFRESVRTISDAKLGSKAHEWKQHLIYAEQSITVYRSAKQRAMEEWKSSDERLEYGMLSFDASAQFDIPTVTVQTHEEFHAEKYGIDVRVLGINNQGVCDGGAQHEYLFIEPFKHETQGTISALNHYLETTCERLGSARILVVQCDSTTSSNKNQMMLAYWVWRVWKGYHDEIVWQFMTVGHTKFDVDRWVGLLRRFMGHHFTAIIPVEFAQGVDESAEHHYGVVVQAEMLRDYSNLAKHTRDFDGIRKKFPYEIKLSARNVDGDRRVFMEVRREPLGEYEPAIDFIKTPMPDSLDGDDYPLNAPVLREQRRQQIAVGTMKKMLGARQLNSEQLQWWLNITREYYHVDFGRALPKWGWEQLVKDRRADPAARPKPTYFFPKIAGKMSTAEEACAAAIAEVKTRGAPDDYDGYDTGLYGVGVSPGYADDVVR